MIAFAQDPGPPTIGDLVPQYVDVGISKRDGVRYIVDSHMRTAVAKGKGRRATRRQLQLELERVGQLKASRGWNTFVEATKRLQAQRNADMMAERYTEARRSRVHDMGQLINFHE